ncbi:hypothetical protein IFM89_015793 [Coptis chinensis]|uniref:DUF4283 domain-containing protein n=1 Tax=Coptis chinensis TaxID=261450 RepID=A0A835IN29_9MAGN|nr:hypothetical protein IFM89_015793 [Coptis chinensis]
MANHQGSSSTTRGFFIDKRLPFPLASEKDLEKTWKITTSYEISTDDDLFYFKFSNDEERKRVLERGTFFVAGRIFLIRQWSEELEYQRSLINIIPIWVKFSAIPKQLWTRKGISLIASRIRKPLSWDASTKNRQRLNFALVCVEVNVHDKYPKSLRFKLGGGRIATILNTTTKTDEVGTSCLRNEDGASILQEKENNVEEPVDDLDGKNSYEAMILRNGNINLETLRVM